MWLHYCVYIFFPVIADNFMNRNMLSTICCLWPLLCMKNKEHYDGRIDLAVKYTQKGYSNKRSRKMRWNSLIIILTFPITFRVMK